jgi:transposase InsO family protein
MLAEFWTIMSAALSSLKSQRSLALENLALRHQITVLQRSAKRPRLSARDRAFWVLLSRFWQDWASALAIVKPETVVRWHKLGFRRFWAWKSRRKTGRRGIDPDIRDLIQKMSQANPTWGAPRIHGELLKLGLEVSQATISRYMIKQRKPPSQTWRAFLLNHVKDLVSIDFFVVPTVTFRVLFVFIVLAHDRRRVIHFSVTEHPTASWTGQQVVEAFPYDSGPRFMIRDRDGAYGHEFNRRVDSMGIEQVLIAPRSPWQNPYVERVIGSIRRECLDHIIVLNEVHLRRLLKEYFKYYHRSRTHLSLDKDCPEPRPVSPASKGEIVEFPVLGGLHHRYTRRAG